MKLSTVTAKLTFVKSNVVRVLAAATFAGAVLAVAPAAQAQQFDVHFGGPRYYAPAPVRDFRFEEHRRWEEQRRFEEERRFREFHHYHGYWR